MISKCPDCSLLNATLAAQNENETAHQRLLGQLVAKQLRQKSQKKTEKLLKQETALQLISTGLSKLPMLFVAAPHVAKKKRANKSVATPVPAETTFFLETVKQAFVNLSVSASFDWVMFARDDTFVFVSALKLFVADQ